jgi:hypothetical protein
LEHKIERKSKSGTNLPILDLALQLNKFTMVDSDAIPVVLDISPKILGKIPVHRGER